MTEELINKAQNLFAEGHEDEAIAILQPLIEAGSIVAKSNLGLLLAHYYKKDKFLYLKEGEKLLLEACEAGEPSACHNLGTLWLGNSPAIGKDLKKAAFFYLKAKELGGPVANEEFYERWERELND